MLRPRKPLAEWFAVAVFCCALPPAVRAAALAAAAGTLFEAAPFVLAAALVPRGRAARVLGFLSCGCGRRGPGALSLPALGLCWFAFGPTVALARAAAAFVLRFCLQRRRRPHLERAADATHRTVPRQRPAPHSNEAADPLDELAGLAPQALAGALLAEVLRGWLGSTPLLGVVPPTTAALVGGLGGALLGVLLPCTTGAVAVAAGLRSFAPAASAGLLATAGIVVPRAPMPRTRLRSARLGYALLAVACGIIACRGPSGFINPRFIVPLGGTALVAAAFALRPKVGTAAHFPAAIPALLAAATLAGSPLPNRPPTQTVLDAPYAGESLRFVGALAPVAKPQRATLVRYTITCCRADAEARAVRLDRSLAGTAGSWYEATGTLGLDAAGAYVMRVAAVRRIAPPADPFAYR